MDPDFLDTALQWSPDQTAGETYEGKLAVAEVF